MKWLSMFAIIDSLSTAPGTLHGRLDDIRRCVIPNTGLARERPVVDDEDSYYGAYDLTDNYRRLFRNEDVGDEYIAVRLLRNP